METFSTSPQGTQKRDARNTIEANNDTTRSRRRGPNLTAHAGMPEGSTRPRESTEATQGNFLDGFKNYLKSRGCCPSCLNSSSFEDNSDNTERIPLEMTHKNHTAQQGEVDFLRVPFTRTDAVGVLNISPQGRVPDEPESEHIPFTESEEKYLKERTDAKETLRERREELLKRKEVERTKEQNSRIIEHMETERRLMRTISHESTGSQQDTQNPPSTSTPDQGNSSQTVQNANRRSLRNSIRNTTLDALRAARANAKKTWRWSEKAPSD